MSEAVRPAASRELRCLGVRRVRTARCVPSNRRGPSEKGNHVMRFTTLLRARRSTRSQARPSSFRLRLERLEERLVPASPVDGTILVATLPSQGFTQTDQGSFPTGLVGVNPNLPPPNQSQVSTDALLGSGNYLVFPT